VNQDRGPGVEVRPAPYISRSVSPSLDRTWDSGSGETVGKGRLLVTVSVAAGQPQQEGPRGVAVVYAAHLSGCNIALPVQPQRCWCPVRSGAMVGNPG
jgi:hypothetical protein